MMMTMRSRSRNNRRLVPFLIACALVVCIGVAILFSGTLFRVGSALVVSLSLSHTQEYELLPRSVLASRLADAEKELSRIRYQSVLSDALIKENEQLLHELDIQENSEVGVGRIVSRPPRTHYDTLLIALNDTHTVSKGDLVLFNTILLGEVSKVSKEAALVTLFSSPGTVLDVRVGEPSAIVVAQGLGGGAFVFDVPNEVRVESGDYVTSASHSTRVVAVVQNVIEEPDKTTKRVHAHTVVAVSDIQFVHFVRPTPIITPDS